MVSRLAYLKQDPQAGMDRGAGEYYHRGKGVWSKYSAARDLNRRASTRLSRAQVGTRVKHKGMAHMGDYHKGAYRSGNYW